jgi:hypothetical protein
MLEVYQDLTLEGDPGARPGLRAALIEKTQAPWRHAPEKEEELRKNAHTAEVAAFERLQTDNLPAASLFLWETDKGYYVSNIVRNTTRFPPTDRGRTRCRAGFRYRGQQSRKELGRFRRRGCRQGARALFQCREQIHRNQPSIGSATMARFCCVGPHGECKPRRQHPCALAAC